MLKEKVASVIRNVPDFPKPGINFKDITPVLMDYSLCAEITLEMANQYRNKGVTSIVGVESRGFLFGMLLSQELKVPFITVRKKGKLPYKTVSYKYDLEYGSAEIEMHIDAVSKGDKVLIHDDLLATGGTAMAAAEIVKMQGGEIAGFAFLVELEFLNGYQKLLKHSSNIYKLIEY